MLPGDGRNCFDPMSNTLPGNVKSKQDIPQRNTKIFDSQDTVSKQKRPTIINQLTFKL